MPLCTPVTLLVIHLYFIPSTVVYLRAKINITPAHVGE